MQRPVWSIWLDDDAVTPSLVAGDGLAGRRTRGPCRRCHAARFDGSNGTGECRRLRWRRPAAKKVRGPKPPRIISGGVRRDVRRRDVCRDDRHRDDRHEGGIRGDGGSADDDAIRDGAVRSRNPVANSSGPSDRRPGAPCRYWTFRLRCGWPAEARSAAPTPHRTSTSRSRARPIQ